MDDDDMIGYRYIQSILIGKGYMMKRVVGGYDLSVAVEIVLSIR